MPAKMMKYREEADYNPAYSFTEEDFIEFRKEAAKAAEEVQVYLTQEKYIQSARD